MFINKLAISHRISISLYIYNKLIKVRTDCSLIPSSIGEHYKAVRAARKAFDILKFSEGAKNNYYNSRYPWPNIIK